MEDVILSQSVKRPICPGVFGPTAFEGFGVGANVGEDAVAWGVGRIALVWGFVVRGEWWVVSCVDGGEGVGVVDLFGRCGRGLKNEHFDGSVGCVVFWIVGILECPR